MNRFVIIFLLSFGFLSIEAVSPCFPVQHYYSEMHTAFDNENWKRAIDQAKMVYKYYPNSPFAQEARFTEAVAHYNRKDYDKANKKFTDYLQYSKTMKHFEEAIQYKFEIAEKFRTGTRVQPFGFKMLPRMLSRKEQAVQIYDEVISSLPHHELAARALYGKGLVLCKDHEYRSGVETFQTAIRRFPKHPVAVQSYIEIGKAYLNQCKEEYPDPDMLALAEINLRKFRQDFPGEESYDIAEGQVNQMKEIFADSFYDVAKYYERIKKWDAAKIYHLYILRNYPHTEIAHKTSMRLEKVEEILASGYKPWWKKIAKAPLKQRVDQENRYNFALLEGEEPGLSIRQELIEFFKNPNHIPKVSLKQRAFDEDEIAQ